MAWDAIGAVGEILGAVAVFASLAYLAIQIKSSARIAQAQSERELLADWNMATQNMWSTPESTRRASAGFADLASLSDEERLMFGSDLSRVANSHFAIWRMLNSGLISEEVAHACDAALVGVLSAPGGRAWWESSKAWWAPGYQAYIDSKLAAGNPVTMDGFIEEFADKR